MTSYSKDTIRELMDGTLPWPQTRRIMSAYKDEDRFFKVIEVLQDRVKWKDPILLPVGEHLFIAETAKGRVTKCECGHDHRAGGNDADSDFRACEGMLKVQHMLQVHFVVAYGAHCGARQ